MGISKLFNKGAYFGLAFCLAFSYLCIIPVNKVGAISATYVSDCTDLQDVADDLAGYYVQTASFSCTGIVDFVPIGTSGSPFVGTYDGGNFEITGLTIASTNYLIGLYGKSEGTLQNIKLVGANVYGDGDDSVGALVGMNEGSITNSSSSGTVNGSHHVGGLVGYNITNGVIADSHSSAITTGSDDYVGGLVGKNNYHITDSYATGLVTGNNSYTGGLVGENSVASASEIKDSYATGDVVGEGYSGGLVGYNNNVIVSSYATGSVTGAYGTGGLVGANNGGLITISHAIGTVTSIDENVGGLVGLNTSGSMITASFATGDIFNEAGLGLVGGLVGSNNSSTIRQSYSSGDVNSSADNIGGLVGYSSGGIVEKSFAIGNVTGQNKVGGLVGLNRDSSSITDAYALGSVTGNDEGLGVVGGLVGGNRNSSITNSYAVGPVTGPRATGGLVGANVDGGVITYSYYDQTTTLQSDVGKGTGKTTAEMKTQSTYQPGEGDWDFSNPEGIWAIDTTGANNNSYPYFQWQDYTGPTFEALGSGDTRSVNIDAGQVITTNPYIIKVLPDDPSGVTKVEFYIDNVLICTDDTADADGYYTCSWDTSKYHSDVKIIAYDAFGNTTALTRSTTVLLTGVPNTGLQPVSFLSAGLVVIAGIGLMIVARRRIS
jgi:hypothetical protein